MHRILHMTHLTQTASQNEMKEGHKHEEARKNMKWE